MNKINTPDVLLSTGRTITHVRKSDDVVWAYIKGEEGSEMNDKEYFEYCAIIHKMATSAR